jgi:hypothetical protein
MLDPDPDSINQDPQHWMEISSLFLFLWAILVLLDPDPADKNQCGSESATLPTFTSCDITTLCLH